MNRLTRKTLCGGICADALPNGGRGKIGKLLERLSFYEDACEVFLSWLDECAPSNYEEDDYAAGRIHALMHVLDFLCVERYRVIPKGTGFEVKQDEI